MISIAPAILALFFSQPWQAGTGWTTLEALSAANKLSLHVLVHVVSHDPNIRIVNTMATCWSRSEDDPLPYTIVKI